MSFNGSGTYSPPTPEYPAIANTVIYAADFNTIIADIASGLSSVLCRDGQAAMTGALDFGGYKGVNLLDPTAAQDAATKAYADLVGTNTLASALTVISNRSWYGYKITDLNTPTASTDAANKAYVDGVAFSAALPSQTGNAGKFITTDGSSASWIDIDATQTLTDAATINWNMTNGTIATVTLGGNRTMAAPTNLGARPVILVVNQDATGSRTITWNSVFKWPAGSAPVLSTAANAKDIFSFFTDGTNLYGSYLRGVA